MSRQHPIAKQLEQFLCPGCSDQDISALLEEAQFAPSLSAKLNRDLTNYIYLSVTHQHLGYVLFGSKPCSYVIVISDQNASTITNRTKPSITELNSMLDYVSRKKTNPDFVIKKLKDSSSSVSQLTAVLTISKNKFLEVVSENLDLFKQKFGDDFSADQMLNKLLNSESLDQIFSPLSFPECEHLFGIMLGYGRECSLAWQKYQELNRETTYSNETTLNSTPLPDGYIVNPVTFKFPDSLEVKALIQKYDAERRQIEQVIQSGNLVDEVCQKLLLN